MRKDLKNRHWTAFETALNDSFMIRVSDFLSWKDANIRLRAISIACNDDWGMWDILYKEAMYELEDLIDLAETPEEKEKLTEQRMMVDLNWEEYRAISNGEKNVIYEPEIPVEKWIMRGPHKDAACFYIYAGSDFYSEEDNDSWVESHAPLLRNYDMYRITRKGKKDMLYRDLMVIVPKEGTNVDMEHDMKELIGWAEISDFAIHGKDQTTIYSVDENEEWHERRMEEHGLWIADYFRDAYREDFGEPVSASRVYESLGNTLLDQHLFSLFETAMAREVTGEKTDAVRWEKTNAAVFMSRMLPFILRKDWGEGIAEKQAEKAHSLIDEYLEYLATEDEGDN